MPTKKTSAADEAAIMETGQLELPDMYANMSYDDMVAAMEQQLDVVPGSDLIEDKDELEKVPFIITRFVFRPSDMSTREYVSVEIKSKKHGDAVFNDGSTGVRSQLLSYCFAKGWCRFLPTSKIDPKTLVNLGDLGKVSTENDLDWIGDCVSVTFGKDGRGMTAAVSVSPGLWAPRGLRVSRDYEVDVNGKTIKASTYYLG